MIAPDQNADTCSAAQYVDFVGQDATMLERVLLLAPVRIIRPGTMVTADHNPDRLNFHVDGAGRVIRLSCG